MTFTSQSIFTLPIASAASIESASTSSGSTTTSSPLNFTDAPFPDPDIAMSLHRAGDVAPLPSPTSSSGPSGHYFAPMDSTADQSQQQQMQQQGALFQAQRNEQVQQTQEQFLRRQQEQEHQQLQLRLQRQQQLEQQGHSQQSQGFSQYGQCAPSPSQAQRQQDAAQMQGPPPMAPPQGYNGQHLPQHRQMSDSSTDSEASLHLREFSLVAEAAKRAQVAVVTRDMEDVSL